MKEHAINVLNKIYASNYISQSNRDILCAIVLTIFSASIALYGLGRYDFLWNEPITIAYSNLSWLDLLGQLHQKTILPDNQPLYFMLLKAWRYVFGSTAFSVRCLSVLAYTSFIPAFYFLCRIANVRWGLALFCSAALALEPKIIYFAQEARWYELSLLFAVICTGEFLALMNSKNTSIIVFVIMGFLGELTFFFFTPFYIFCVICILKYSPVSKNKKWALALCGLGGFTVSIIGSIFSLYQYRFIHRVLPVHAIHFNNIYSSSYITLPFNDYPILAPVRNLIIIMSAIALLGVFISRWRVPGEILLLETYSFISIVLTYILSWGFHLDEISFRYISIIYPVIYLSAAVTIEIIIRSGFLSKLIILLFFPILCFIGIEDFFNYQQTPRVLHFQSIAPAVDDLEELVLQYNLPIYSDNPYDAKYNVIGLLEARMNRPFNVTAFPLDKSNSPPGIVIFFNSPNTSVINRLHGHVYRVCPSPPPFHLFIGTVNVYNDYRKITNDTSGLD